MTFASLLSSTAITNFVSAFAFFAGVNVQGLVGSDSVIPGVIGTDWFTVSAANVGYIAPRSKGAPIRVPFLWERLQPLPGGALDTTHLAILKAIADAALAAGTSVFFDCHNYMRRYVYNLNSDGSIATTASPSTGTMYAAKGRYAVDAPDGNVTRAHLADLWTKVATYFYGHKGVAGYDVMNEPTGDNAFGPNNNGATDLPPIMQASVNAIAAVDTSKLIWVEGNSYSSAKNWVSNNPNYPLSDPTNQVIYSGHAYPDYDHSGTHFGYAGNASPPSGDALTATTLVDITTSFVNWGSSKGVRIHIGETNVGTDDARWNTVLLNGLNYWKSKGVPVNLWYFGEHNSTEPYNLFPYSGSEAPQWAVIEQVVGAVQEAPVLNGPGNGSNGTAATGFSVAVPGYVSSSQTPVLSDGGAGGTFSSVAAVQPGANPVSVTFSYTPNGTKVVSITATVGGVVSNTLAFSSDPANPVNLVPAADRGFATWYTSQSALSQTTGYNAAAARLADNSSNAPHVAGAPSAYPINPGAPFEIDVSAHADSITAIGLAVGNVQIHLDIANSTITVGSLGPGSTITGGTVSTDSNGYRLFRIGFQLAASIVTIQPQIQTESPLGTTGYSGGGAPVFLGSFNGYQGPINSLLGKPIALSPPTFTLSSGVATASHGTYANGGTSYTQQWLRDGVAISGATGTSYTTVTADQGHALSFQETPTNAQGAGLVSTSASTQIVNPSAFVPTQLAQTKRFFSAGDSSTITQASGTVSAWADKAGSGKAFAVNNTAPAYVGSSTFGGSRAAIRNANSNGTKGSAGEYGSLIADFSSLSASTAFAIFSTVSLDANQNYGRLLSLASTASNDYNTNGAFAFSADNAGPSVQLNSNGLVGSDFAATIDAPMLVGIVFDGANSTFWINGVSQGTAARTAGMVAAAQLSLFRDAYDGTQIAFGDVRAIVATTGALATADRQKLEGYLAWDATGDGSLLPTGHPYKSAAP